MGPGALDEYYAILKGQRTPKYLSAKQARVAVHISAPTEDLWHAHANALREVAWGGPTGLLELKAELARRIQSECAICERMCGTRRNEGEVGHCGVLEARISSEFLHMGEEPDLVPSYTVFFAGCTFDCVFCQNWDISTHPRSGIAIQPQQLARMIAARTKASGGRGSDAFGPEVARNVNWVGGDPSPNLLYILQTLCECEANIPQVWNSNMYLTEKSMALLEGVIDVYLTDFKYGNDACALRLSNAPRYMQVVTRNHILARDNAEMIVRHLVLPGHVECCTRPVLSWIASNLERVKVNVMAQYRPEHRARDFPNLSRRLRASEYEQAIQIANELGLNLID